MHSIHFTQSNNCVSILKLKVIDKSVYKYKITESLVIFFFVLEIIINIKCLSE